jgi:hypothetical protein
VAPQILNLVDFKFMFLHIYTICYVVNGHNINLFQLQCNLNTVRFYKILNTVLFKKSVINMVISLYNKVPDQIKLGGNFNLFKKDLKSFPLNHSFYSVEELMSF